MPLRFLAEHNKLILDLPLLAFRGEDAALAHFPFYFASSRQKIVNFPVHLLSLSGCFMAHTLFSILLCKVSSLVLFM